MAERNLKTSPLYELTITGRQTGGQTEKPLIGARACALPKKLLPGCNLPMMTDEGVNLISLSLPLGDHPKIRVKQALLFHVTLLEIELHKFGNSIF